MMWEVQKMTRGHRDHLFDELQDLMKKSSKMIFGEILPTLDDSDECQEMVKMLTKTFKLTDQLMDYAKFQAHQIDSIEDQINNIYEVVMKIETKGGVN